MAISSTFPRGWVRDETESSNYMVSSSQQLALKLSSHGTPATSHGLSPFSVAVAEYQRLDTLQRKEAYFVSKFLRMECPRLGSFKGF
jgi:hypothetical protein